MEAVWVSPRMDPPQVEEMEAVAAEKALLVLISGEEIAAALPQRMETVSEERA